MIVFDLMAFSWGFNGVLMVCASSSVQFQAIARSSY